MEMNARQLYSRMICLHSGIDKDRFEKGDFTKEEQVVFDKSVSKIKTAKIFVDDSPRLTPLDLRIKSRQLKSKNPDLALIIIDYFQLIDVKAIEKNSRKDQLAYAARSLKNFALDLDVPILVLSMLSRGNSAIFKPQLSQLNHWYLLEEYSDKIILLHRPENNSGKLEDKNALEVMIVKNRNGKGGSFKA